MSLGGGNSTARFVTIKAGESYILKKSSRIISIAKYGDAVIDAPCFDVSNVEEYGCYVIKGFTARPNNSSATINGEEQYARGIYIGTNFYAFSASYMIDDGENLNLVKELNTRAPFKDVMKNVCYVEDTDSSRGTTFYYTFLSIPSLANVMRMFVQGAGIHTHGKIDLYYPAMSLAYLQATNEDATSLCGCGASS